MKRTENAYRMAQQLKSLRAMLMGETKSQHTLFQIRNLLRPSPLTELSPAVMHLFYQTAVPVEGPLDTPCLIWGGPRDKDGYGLFYADGRKYSAHRLSYQLAHGVIPDHKEVCHLCNQNACISGDHLQVGTHAENMKHRAESGQTWNQYTPAVAKVPILPVVEYQEGEMVI